MTELKAVILQPSYIPWRGYFHQVWKADVFVFYDDVQYDKRGWRNRNKIKTPDGLRWLTIPVHSRGVQTDHITIDQIRPTWDEQHPWTVEHWKALQHAYGKAPSFKRYSPLLEQFFALKPEFLADFTIDLTVALARELGIHHTRFLRSSALGASGQKTARLVDVLQKIGATHYISGPSAQDYIEPGLFRQAGITLEYMVYDYPEYPQLYPPYEPNVSILDLLFMTGPDALKFIIKRQDE
jgi:hypothetical protein